MITLVANSITRFFVMSQQLIEEPQRYKSIIDRICSAEKQAKRESGSVTLIAATKTKPSEQIRRYYDFGLRHAGENYLQEAVGKIDDLRDTSLTWHFIGHLQSNKTRSVAENFDWVHGVDRLKVAERLARQHNRKTPINLLVQLNLDNEETKSGLDTEQAIELAAQISELDGCRVRGFMSIPMARDTVEAQRAVFSRAREALELANERHGLRLDQLSMGMSGDLEAAILEGATMVRVGSALLGPRS